jgi:rhomboid protease GluP
MNTSPQSSQAEAPPPTNPNTVPSGSNQSEAAKTQPNKADAESPDPWPATLLLGTAWVLVFAGMVWHQGSLHRDPTHWLEGGINVRTAYLFGSISTADLQRGEYWRILTATFVHFSILHLVVNLVVLYQLGRLTEGWYGPWQFLGLYVAIGSLANLAASIIRPWLGQSPFVPSGGGSGVLCGLIGLVAFVGWRSKDQRGQYMLMVMSFQLIFLGVMGMVSVHVKNLVHAMGVLAGLFLGAFDPWMLRSVGKVRARLVGACAIAVLLAAAGLQWRSATTGVRKAPFQGQGAARPAGVGREDAAPGR